MLSKSGQYMEKRSVYLSTILQWFDRRGSNPPYFLHQLLLGSNYTSDRSSAQPIAPIMMRNFERIGQLLEEEGDSELYALIKSNTKMKELNLKRHLKEKALDHYCIHIYFCEHLPGRPNLLSFKDMAAWTLEDCKWKDHQDKIDIITAAPEIIKSAIREMPVDRSAYPSWKDMRDTNYQKASVPDSLQIFVGHYFPSELEELGFGYCIVHASQLRSVIASIPFGISVQLDKSFGTKWFVDHLAKHDFQYHQTKLNCSKN